MNVAGFRTMLKKRKMPADKIRAAVALAQRFEEYVQARRGSFDADTTWAFCKTLIQEGQNSYDNLVAAARYGQFLGNNSVYVAALELLDGREAQPNLYRRVGELFGAAVRDDVFAGIGVAPLGTPTPEKPGYMFPVLERLVERVGQKRVQRLLSACLRDLPDAHFGNERRRYLRSRDIDDYAVRKHRAFVRTLQKCQREGELFFAQEITDEVVEFVKRDQEIEGGVREGNVIYESKIPYNTKRYLAETDSQLKRYYACHCPWAREAIRNGAVRVNPIFCYCSGGFSKKPWEVIFGQELEVELLESVLQGDMRCRFAIRLPEGPQFT